MLEAGLIQRVKALNAFLYDIYHEKKIVSYGVVPKEFTYVSKGYMRDTETLLQVGGGNAGIITVRIPEACVSAQSYPRQSFRNILQSFHRSV